MTTSNTKIQCVCCKKEIRTLICERSSLQCCIYCLTKHVQELNQEFDQIENDHHQFRKKLNEQKENRRNHRLIQEINEWEIYSINKIKKKADECRQRVINYANEFIIKLENKLNDIVKKLKQIRDENNINANDLNESKQKLNKLKEELDRTSNASIKQQLISVTNNISLTIPFNKETIWQKFGTTIAGTNRQGEKLNELCYPEGIFIDNDQSIYIADCYNHRIIQWKPNATNGQIVAGGNEQGSKMNQLNLPTDMIIDHRTNSLIISDWGNRRVMRWSLQNKTKGDVIISDIDCYGLRMDKHGSLYVCDWKKNTVIRWKRGEKNGTLVAGGYGEGYQLNQLNNPTFIFIDEDDSLYISDSNNNRVIKWVKNATQGIVVAGGNGRGNNLAQLSYPGGVIVDQLGHIYVTDCNNDRVMCWRRGAKEGSIIVGGNGEGQQSNQFAGPIGLSFDGEGNLHVADYWNHRIQKIEVE